MIRVIRKKDKNESFKATPLIEEKMVGFVPRFGNNIDILIAKTYEEITDLLRLARMDEERRRELNKIIKTKSKRIEMIESKEKSLLYMLEKRSRELSTE